jgi:acetolactate synthase-1/2/3 large subunit
LADGYGIRYISAKSTQELKEALYIGIDAIGPLIIEVFVNPEEKLYPKVQAHISSSGEITSMPIEDMSPLLDINELKESMKYTQIKPSSYAARGLKKE